MSFKEFPKYFTLFTNLEDLVKQKYPNEYEAFRFYKMDLMFKLEYLELICLRYESDKKNWEQTGKRMNKLIENVKSKSLSQNELQKESQVLGMKTVLYSRLLMLDKDSFYVFANVLLDSVPSLLRPLYKGKITNLDIEEKHFKTFAIHLDWLKKNRESVLDSVFYDRIISYRNWFWENLTRQRNKIIVHPELNTFRSEIDFSGKLNRIEYNLSPIGENRKWVKMESTEFPDISSLFKKIIEFLEFLNGYFLGIL